MLHLNNISTALSSSDVGFIQPLIAAGEGFVDISPYQLVGAKPKLYQKASLIIALCI